ncbi:hypothetical protein AcidC75_20190 [Acidisoma sp. C75]
MILPPVAFWLPGSKTTCTPVGLAASGGVLFGKVMISAAIAMACRAAEIVAAIASRLAAGLCRLRRTIGTRLGLGRAPAGERDGVRRGLAMRANESL